MSNMGEIEGKNGKKRTIDVNYGFGEIESNNKEKKMKSKITLIIEKDDKKIELTEDEMMKLYNQLKGIFDVEKIQFPYVPYYPTFPPIQEPYYTPDTAPIIT